MSKNRGQSELFRRDEGWGLEEKKEVIEGLKELCE